MSLAQIKLSVIDVASFSCKHEVLRNIWRLAWGLGKFRLYNEQYAFKIVSKKELQTVICLRVCSALLSLCTLQTSWIKMNFVLTVRFPMPSPGVFVLSLSHIYRFKKNLTVHTYLPMCLNPVLKGPVLRNEFTLLAQSLIGISKGKVEFLSSRLGLFQQFSSHRPSNNCQVVTIWSVSSSAFLSNRCKSFHLYAPGDKYCGLYNVCVLYCTEHSDSDDS